MATGGLYGNSGTGALVATPGAESSGLYGSTTSFGGTYFEWFIFQEAVSQPATPTGGSWSFGTNTGTPPSGWTLQPPAAPVNQVWVSIALVNSRSTTGLVWSVPGLFGVVPNITFGTVVTGAPGTNAAVVNTGTSTNPNLIFTIPRGDVGATGATGAPGAAATIAAGTTTTGAPGSSATVVNSGTSNAAIFDFTIPRGDVGATGPTGATGATGAAATIAAGTTTTTAPGTSASVTNSGTSGAAVFDFSIPRGAGVNSGGATGQVLTKASGTDYDTTWTNITGGLDYRGTWNASTNTPTLVSSVGTNGYYYIVSVAGTTNLDGITDWQVGDWVIFNGSAWQKLDQTNLVTSVNGFTGAVVLTNTDISGFGTMSTQNANAVAITGGTESGVTHSGDIIGNYLDYTPGAAPTYAEGRTWYDSTAKALSYYNDVSGVQIHVGHDLQFKVINNTGSTIPNGSPVYITGTSSGQTYPNVALAKADVAATSSVIGLTDGAIANGAAGYVTSIGNIDNVNTGSFTVGQVLYLSPYSAGQLMNTLPPTGITVQVGVVTFVNSSTGKIYVKQTTPLTVPASILTGTVAIANGGTGQTTANAAFNALAPSQTSNSGKYLTTDGTNSSWASIVAGASLSNDTTTATNLYPMFAAATSGTPTTVYTSNAQYLFKPSTGELSVKAPRASNGIVVNSATISSDYTIATGDNGMSAGPVSVNSGITVTISSGSRWVVL
jgi:hypothetical protein